MPLTIRELLSDKTYKEFFISQPKVNKLMGTTPAWWVYFQKDPQGRWARTEADTYKDAFRLLKPRVKDFHDICIVSKRQGFDPPSRTVKVTRGGKPVLVKAAGGQMVQQTAVVLWTPKRLIVEAELSTSEVANTAWCFYCRRPTHFTYFPRHHAFTRAPVFDPSRRRCHICGISSVGAGRRLVKV